MTYLNTYADPVASTFSRIVDRCNMTTTDDRAFQNHARRAATSLGGTFNVQQFVTMGSYSRGSAMKGVSDLDLLVILDAAEVRWGESVKSSTTVLNSVRTVLANTFWHTDLGRDGQAIVLRFSGGRSIDVVPGYQVRTGGGVYAIPDGGGSWMKTAPEKHSDYIARGEVASGRKLKSVVKLLKYWKETRALSLPISSFHLEMLLTKERVCAPGKTLSACTADALMLLAKRECRALQDPCGISGYIHAAGSESKRGRLLAAVKASETYAISARIAELEQHPTDAMIYWNLVFNRRFS